MRAGPADTLPTPALRPCSGGTLPAFRAVSFPLPDRGEQDQYRQKRRDLLSLSFSPEISSRRGGLSGIGEEGGQGGGAFAGHITGLYSGDKSYGPEPQAGRAGLFSNNSLVARLLEEQAHAGWDTVEGFYVWRVIGLFPAPLLDSLGGQGGLGNDERCDPKPSRRKEKPHFILGSRQAPVPSPGAQGGGNQAPHSPRVLPVHSHDALHAFAELLHLQNLLLLHVLQKLRELRERGPVVETSSLSHTH